MTNEEMPASADERAEEESKDLEIDWATIEQLPPLYATNMVIQHTESEFIINLYQLLPPVIWGTEEQKRARIEEMSMIQTTPLARVVITADRMPGFVRALKKNLDVYETKFGAFEPEGGEVEEEAK
jgi:hypothetical protein